MKEKQINKQNIPITKEIKSEIINFPTQKNTGPKGFSGKFYQIFKEFIPILLENFPKIEEEETVPNWFYNTSITLIPKPDNSTTK